MSVWSGEGKPEFIERLAQGVDPRQRLPPALIAKLGRLRPDHLAHNLRRYSKLISGKPGTPPHRWKAAQFPDMPEKISPKSGVTSSEVFPGDSPHLWAPPLGVILAEQFTPEERQPFVPFFRSRIGAAQSAVITRIAYLTATGPIK